MKRKICMITIKINMIPFLLFLFLFLAAPQITAGDPAYKPIELILLSCGTNISSTVGGQFWIGDAGTNLSPDVNTPGLSTPVTADPDPSFINQAPFFTARVIHYKLSYIFPLSPGQKILRLYFYPDNYYSTTDKSLLTFDKTKSFFSVTANQYNLLKDFNAYATVAGAQTPFVVKEYIINVDEQTKSLTLTFSPSEKSYAFINGIEVISLPENFYMGSHDQNKPLIFVNSPGIQFDLDSTKTAFEALYRSNMGGPTVERKDDTGMFREWKQDNEFLVSLLKGIPVSNDSISLSYTSQTPSYSAPETVYRTARAMGEDAKQPPPAKLFWTFAVETGFVYLFRLHFCELQPSLIFKEGQRVFNLTIDGLQADTVDIIHLAGGAGIPMFRDYVVLVANDPPGVQQLHNIELAVSPDRDSRPQYLDTLVNGVEVFKLSADGNLAGINSPIPKHPPRTSSRI